MNGRVEDAILGRFLKPGSTHNESYNAQSYNRYSYVNNNPLTFVDPTGFDLCQQPSSQTTSADSAPEGTGCTPADPDTGFYVMDPDSIPEQTVTSTRPCGSIGALPCIGSGYTQTLLAPPVIPAIPGGGGGGGTPSDTLPEIVVTAQSNNPITPCPSGTLSNFAYALHDFGMNSMKTGAAGAVLAQNGLIAAAPYAETPAGADAVLVNEALGLASDFTFAIGAASAAIGGGTSHSTEIETR